MSIAAIELGKRIRYIRTSKHLSQEEVAFKANISPAHLGQIERAAKNPTIDTIEKISVALNVSLPELFSFDTAPDTASLDESAVQYKINAYISSMSEEEQKALFKLIKGIKSFKDIK